MRSVDTRMRFIIREVDERCGERNLELMSVSMTKGVVPRSTLTDDLPRADDLANYKVCRAGDIVVNRMSAYQGALGMSGHTGIVSPDYIVFRPANGVSPRWLHHLMRSTTFVSEMSARIRGIGSIGTANVRTPRVSSEEIGEIRVRVPSDTSQIMIADYLDAETARIDDLIAKKQRVVELIWEKRNALIQTSVTGASETSRRGDTNGRTFWFGTVPDGWSVARLKDHVEVTNGFPFDSRLFNDSIGTPVIRIRDILRGRCETFVDGPVPPSAMVGNGDLLVGMDGDFNSVVWSGGDAALNQRLCRLAAMPSLNPRFLRYVVNPLLRHVNDLTYATTVKHLSSADLLNERFVLPDMAKQCEIVDCLDAKVARLDRIIFSIESQQQLLREHRQALITAAVTGELAIPGMAT